MHISLCFLLHITELITKLILSFLILAKQLRATRGRPSFSFIFIGEACLRTGDGSSENHRKSSGTHADGLEQRPLVVPLELSADLHQVHLTA